MTDIEQSIERDLERGERHNGREACHKWVKAMIAYRIVGRRIDGLTKEFGRRCGVKEDSVEQWAKAWRMYRVFRYISGRQHANRFRREFSVSHFYAMWELAHKYKLSVYKIFNYFSQLSIYKNVGESWSVEALRREVEADYSDGKSVSWRWHWQRITGDNLRTLLSFDGELPLAVKAWARMGLGLKDKVK